MKRKSRNITPQLLLAIEFFDQWCKLLAIGMKGDRLFVAHCEAIQEANNQTQLLRERIAALRSKEIAISAVLIIPRTQAIFREIRIPSADPTELHQMMSLQVENINPNLNKEDVVYDYLARTLKDKTSLVLLYLMKKELVKQQMMRIKGCGVPLKNVFLSSEATAKLMVEWLKKSNQEGTVGVIEIDRLCTEVIVLNQEKILFSRGMNLGIEDLSEKKITLDQFLEDLVFTLMVYHRSKADTGIERLILTGLIGSATAELTEKLSERLAKPIHQISMTELLQTTQVTEGIEKTLQAQISLIPLLGGIVHQENLTMDFFPEEVHSEERRKDFKKTLAIGVMLVALLFTIWGVILTICIGQKQILVNQLVNTSSQLKPIAKELEDFKRRLSTVKELVIKRKMLLESLNLLYEKAPKEVFLTSFDYSANPAKLDVQGAAVTLKAIFDYVGNLKNVTVFKDIDLKYTNKKKTEKGDAAFEFRITANVIPEKFH